MAQDNIANKMDDFDTRSAVYNATTEFIEFGLEYGESMDLLPGANKSSVKSVKSSISSTISQAKTIFSYIISGFKWFLTTTKTFWFVVVYSIIGALVFMYIETPADLESRLEQRQYHLTARDVLAFNIRQIHESKRLDAEYEIKQAIIQFEENLGISMPEEETAWTFWMSILYAGTIYTTIGYGNIACVTTVGRFVTIVYALIGIPMMIVVLDQLGDFLLRIVKKGASIMEDLLLFIGVKTKLIRIKSEKSLSRYIKVSKTMSFLGLSSSVPSKSVHLANSENGKEKPLSEKESEKSSQVNIEMGKSEASETKDDWKRDPPVFSAVFVTIGWILASAGVFCLWEDWSYSTSIYFFFISTSTIGFGDVSPTHPEYMMATFGVVIVGLSLVSVCINVVQEWLQQWYMNLLQKMLEQYIEAEKNGDQNAAKGFMTGFSQGQMKYVMPLISRNSGQKAMEQLKKEAKEKGIELPPALTELNPETGKPIFLNSTEKQIDQIIEKAQNEGKLTPQNLKPITVSVQAEVFGDREIAQTQTDLSWEFFELRFSKSTQSDPGLIGKIGIDAEAEARPKMKSTAIQPEVSSIFHFFPDTVGYRKKEKLKTSTLVKKETPIESEKIEEFQDEKIEDSEDEEVEALRFLKSTGTQVTVDAVESGDQTEEKPVRSMKSQTKLTTCIQTPEEIEIEKIKLKEERKKEFRKEREARVLRERPKISSRKIILTSDEKSILKTKLLKLRQEAAKKLRQEGKPIQFNINQEKGILTEDLKQMRKSVFKEVRRSAMASVSTTDDEVFLADSEVDSSTSTLPGPRQFAVPSRLDISERQISKKFGILEKIEKNIISSKKSDSEEELSEAGIQLISTPPGLESRGEEIKFGVVRPKFVEEPQPGPSGESGSRTRPRPLFESLSDEDIRSPTAIVEVSQSQPMLTVSEQGYEEITLNIELIRRSISSYGSSSQARSVAGSVSQGFKSPLMPSPTVQVHPELLSSGGISTVLSPSEELLKIESITPEDLPIEELESLIDYDDVFSELDMKEEQEEDLEFFFISTTGIQTDMSYFGRTTVGMTTDPEKFAHGVQTELTALDDEKGPRSIVEKLLPKQTSVSAQTTPVVMTEAIQTVVEKRDKCVGGKVDYESIEVQTMEKETKDVSSEATVIGHKISVQTENPVFIEEGTQVETEKKEVSDSCTETDLRHVSTSTDSELKETKDSISQTDSVKESKTVSAVESRHEKSGIQSDVSILYKPEDLSEAEGDLTFMVDSSTEQDYDLVMQHVMTQHSPDISHVSSQAVVNVEEKTSQTVGESKSMSFEIVYANTAIQTEEEDSGDSGPVLLEANIVSVTSSLSSPAVEENDGQDGLSVEATFPASFFVQSITLTSDVETQVDFIHANVGVQVRFEEFSSDTGTQAEITMENKQTSLDSDDLEPLESGFTNSGAGCLWSDFDVLGIVESTPSQLYYDDEEITAAEAQLASGGDIHGSTHELTAPEDEPESAFPEERKFVRKKVVKKVKKKEPETKDTEKSPKIKESEIKETSETKESAVKKGEVKQPPEVKKGEVKQPPEVKKVEVKQPPEVKKSEVKQPSEVKKSEVKQPSEVKKSEVKQPSKKFPEIKKVEVKELPEIKKSEVKELPEMKESEVKEPSESKKSPTSESQIKLHEFDETRRRRMMDIGIQTGVLARVQHIYSKKGSPGGEDTAGGIKKVTLKKVGSAGTLVSPPQLPTTSESTLSLQEVLHLESGFSAEEPVPGPSSASLQETEPELDPREKARMLALHGRNWMLGKQQTVADLRSKIEKFHEKSKSSTDLLGQKAVSSSSLKSEEEEEEEVEKEEEEEEIEKEEK